MTTDDKTVVKRWRFRIIFGNFNLRSSQHLTEKKLSDVFAGFVRIGLGGGFKVADNQILKNWS